jgi:hypothetical protein
MPEGTGTYGKQRGRPSKAATAQHSKVLKETKVPKVPKETKVAKVAKETNGPIQGKDIPIKTGALSKMLRIPEEDNIPMTLLNRLNKMEIGEEFEQKGRSMKMSPLMKKRVSLAITLKKMKK